MQATNAIVKLDARIQSAHPGYVSKVESRVIPGAGKGLFTKVPVAPGDTVIAIPATALLNPLTIRDSNKGNTLPARLFPQASAPDPPSTSTSKRAKTSRLNTTQLLTLFLALNRDAGRRSDRTWDAYFDTLPESFRPWHPLTWVVPVEEGQERQQQDSQFWLELVKGIPPAVKRKLDDVKQRYEGDAAALWGILTSEEPFKSQDLNLTREDMLWAWLNVNTRTAAIPLGLQPATSLQNHSLVPLFDLINHSSDPDLIIPSPIVTHIPAGPSSSSRSRTAGSHLVPGRVGFQLVAPERGLRKGEQVLFQYGAHSNGTLFAEYGFVELPTKRTKQDAREEDGAEAVDEPRVNVGTSQSKRPSRKGGRSKTDATHPAQSADGDGDSQRSDLDWSRLPHGEVEVTDEPLLDMHAISENKLDILRSIGCADNHVILSHPTPHPSHALLMTLRLMSLSPDEATATLLASVQRGERTYISERNENAVRDHLQVICERLEKESRNRLRDMDQLAEGVRLTTGRDGDRSGGSGGKPAKLPRTDTKRKPDTGPLGSAAGVQGVAEQEDENLELQGKLEAVAMVRRLWEESQYITDTLLDALKRGDSLE